MPDLERAVVRWKKRKKVEVSHDLWVRCSREPDVTQLRRKHLILIPLELPTLHSKKAESKGVP